MKVVCFHYIGDKSHEVLGEWAKSVGAEIIPFFPEKYSFLKGKGLLNQPLGLMHGLKYLNKDIDVFLHTGMASLITTAFLPSKNIVMNADQFFGFFDQYPWIKKKYLKFLLNEVDGFISLNYYMKDLAEKYTDIPNEVAYPYCDIDRFINIQPDLESDTICYIGSSYFPKQVDILLDAFDLIKKDYPKAKLIICGDGPLREQTKREDIVWYKYHEHIEDILKQVGTYINASRHDAFGVNIIEAMAAGIPTIISEFCGAKEILPKSAQYLVTKLDSKEIAQKYKKLKESRKRKEIGEDCRKVAKEFTKERSIKMFKAAFNKLVRQDG